MQVIKFLNEIPVSTWASATFHTHPSAVREMVTYISGAEGGRGASIVCRLASKLDWRQIATRRDSSTLLAFLQLYLTTSVIQGGDHVLGVTGKESAKKATWALLDEDDLRQQFPGDVFVRLLKGTLL